MAQSPTLLHALLRERHLQEHRAFSRAWDSLSGALDPPARSGAPSRAQFYRWLSGNMSGLPHPDSCRVLEAMFPEHTARELLGQPEDASIPQSSQLARPRTGMAGVSAAYVSRADFAHAMPPNTLFDGARLLRMAGVSLNLLCQHYSDRKITDLVESGTELRCLFLDPAGSAMAAREREEGLPAGMLSTLTEVNMHSLSRIQPELSDGHRDGLQLRVYDETVRFNIILVDDRTAVVQPYMPKARGVDSPTLVAERSDDGGTLFDTFEQVFESLWRNGRSL